MGKTGLTYREIAAGIDAIPAGNADHGVPVVLHGGGRKSAQLPLYVWLPDAMAGPRRSPR